MSINANFCLDYGKNPTVVILQPSFMPWLGYFEQLHRSDIFVVYDDVQYDKGSWRNRNRIKSAQGAQWLTVPVLTKGRGRATNREVEINNRVDWRRKHLRALRQNYGGAPFFYRYMDDIAELYDQPWSYLIDLNLATLRLLMRLLGLERDIRLSSSLGVSGQRVDRLIAICRHLRAERFYEGAAGQNYIDIADFHKAGIILEYQQYEHPTYRQMHGGFLSYLSVLDLLFNEGPESLSIITGGRS